MKVKQDTIIRTVLLALALVNQFLIMSGRSVLPISDEQVTLVISTLFTIVVSIINWWKNNSFTQNAMEADEYLRELKAVSKNKQ